MDYLPPDIKQKIHNNQLTLNAAEPYIAIQTVLALLDREQLQITVNPESSTESEVKGTGRLWDTPSDIVIRFYTGGKAAENYCELEARLSGFEFKKLLQANFLEVDDYIEPVIQNLNFAEMIVTVNSKHGIASLSAVNSNQELTVLANTGIRFVNTGFKINKFV